MATQKIETLVTFAETGAHKFTDDYNANMSIEDYINHFQNEANELNNVENANTMYLAITVHDENGNYEFDDRGNILWEAIYINNYYRK